MSKRMLEAAHAELWVAMDVPDSDAMATALIDLDRANRPFGIKLGLEVVTAEGLPKLMGQIRGLWPVFVDILRAAAVVLLILLAGSAFGGNITYQLSDWPNQQLIVSGCITTGCTPTYRYCGTPTHYYITN